MTPQSAIADLLRAGGLVAGKSAVSQDEAGRPRRKARGKRAKRVDVGDRVVFRVSAEERQLLTDEAGELSISTYVRRHLFAGGVRNRDAMRQIALLHVVGRRVQQLSKKPGVEASIIADTLGDICAAIRGLIDDLDDVTDETSAL